MDKVADKIECIVADAIEQARLSGAELLCDIARVATHEEAGLWGTTGLLVTMEDGAVYQIAIVRLPGGPS